MRRLLAIWTLLAAFALAIHLGGYPLLEPDEGRNGEVGREMAATNDYVLPHLDGLPYLDKPVVYFASEAVMIEIFGASEFAARFPAYLFTILTAIVVFRFARRAGIHPYIASIMFLAMPLTVAFARTVIFDSALSLCITIAIIAFYEENPTVAWTAIAFGVLTKGPVAIALPLLVAIPYAIWRKRFRTLWSWLGLVLFVVIIAPWVWGVMQEVPDFLHYVVVTETAQRLATKALKRTGPPWYFVPYVLGGAFPWSIAAFFGGRVVARDPAGPVTDEVFGHQTWRDRFLLLWIAVPFVFFSLSQSKRPQYILPLMPAIALFVASRWNARMTKVAAIAVLILGVLLCGALPFVHLRAEYAGAARGAAIAIGLVTVIAGVVALWRRDLAVVALSLPILVIPIATNGLMQSLATRRSEKAFALAITPYVRNANQVVAFEAFTGSMAFYLERPIVVISPNGEEFTSNYIIRHYATFANRSNLRSTFSFAAEPPLVLIARSKDAKNRAFIESRSTRVIAEDAHYVAYTMR